MRWLNVGKAFGYEFMPLLVWLVILFLALLVGAVGMAVRPSLFGRLRSRWKWIVLCLWWRHLAVAWYGVVVYLNFKYLTLPHFPEREMTMNLWAFERFCEEIFLLSSGVLVWISVWLAPNFPPPMCRTNQGEGIE